LLYEVVGQSLDYMRVYFAIAEARLEMGKLERRSKQAFMKRNGKYADIQNWKIIEQKLSELSTIKGPL